MNPGPSTPRTPQGSARGALAHALVPMVEGREDRGVVGERRGDDEEVEDLVRRKEVVERPGREPFWNAVGAVVWCERGGKRVGGSSRRHFPCGQGAVLECRSAHSFGHFRGTFDAIKVPRTHQCERQRQRRGWQANTVRVGSDGWAAFGSREFEVREGARTMRGAAQEQGQGRSDTAVGQKTRNGQNLSQPQDTTDTHM